MKEGTDRVKWERNGPLYELKQGTRVLVSLRYEALKTCIFYIGTQVFEIRRQGFWNPAYYITQHETEIASLKHQFWGSKGSIKFAEGTVYQVEYKYKNTLTLCIIDNNTEVLRYFVIQENNKRQAFLQLGIIMEDAERLLLLSTLAMVLFLSIFNEFNGKDGEDVIFDLIHLAS